jgi:uncharacterized repeat protein (TIGR01451 family)
MKFILTICLTFLLFQLNAQVWENISPILLKETVDFKNSEVVHYKNITAAYRQSQDQAYIYYTTNFGVNWKKFKAPTIDRGFNDGKQIALNQDGFFLVNNSTINNKIVVFRTKDFGINWSVDSIKPSQPIVYTPKFIYREGVLNLIESTNTAYKFINPNWEQSIKILKDNLSQNRRVVISDYDNLNRRKAFIYNFADSLLATINVQATLYTIYAQDSIIVLLERGTNAESFFTQTSPDLGRTWNQATVNGNITNSTILISKSNIFINIIKNILESKDFGQTWKSLIDDVIGDYRQFAFPRFEVYDSTLLAFNEYNLFIKNINDAKWRFAHYLSGAPSPVVKVGASTIIGVDNYRQVVYQSKDWGKTWAKPQRNPYFDYQFQRFFSIGDTLYLAGRYGFPFDNKGVIKSGDFGKKWESSIPFVDFMVVKNDTIVVKSESGELVYSTKPPYTQWNTIVKNKFAPQIYYNDNIPIHIENGMLYSVSASRIMAIHKFDGVKVDSINLTNMTDFLGFLFNKNKIWAYNDSAHTEINFTENYGKTWAKYALPKKINSFNIKNIGNYLIVNTGTKKVNGKLSPTTGGIYISSDNGKTWSFFSEGITLDNVALGNKLTVIDSFIYVNDANSNLWRTSITNIANTNVKSVSGNVYFDLNKNGRKDSNEMHAFGAFVTASPSNVMTSTDSLGNYSFLLNLAETDTLKVSYDNVSTKTAPMFYVITQSDTAKNFGLILPNVDLKVSITAITPPRPGFNNEYLINYKNVGASSANGDITFNYQAKQSFISANPAPSSNINQALTWTYKNLQINESRTIKATFKTANDVPVRSQLTNIAAINSLNIDTFKADNIDTLVQTVVGSYDPNDKQVTFNNSKTPPSVIDPSTELIYTIRFQNTGNYPADFVKVVDTLSDKLDLTTFRLIAISHKGDVSIRNKNVMTFDFNPIYLPDSIRDEKGSHGFIKFAIKPKKSLTKDEAIRNTGYIYFDYNPAIITNTVETVNQKVNSILTPSVFTENLKIYPNPANRSLNIEIEDEQFKEGFLNIYDMTGRLILSQNVSNKLSVIDVSFLSVGEFICTIKSKDNKIFVNKFLKVQ